MADNTQNNDPKRPKSKSELLAADPDNLTTDELNRRAVFIDLDYKDLQRELTYRQTEQMKMKDAQNRDKFASRGRELRKTDHDQKKHQEGCSHRKGGRSVEALQRGGNAADFAVIRHILPNGELWQRCQRCGKTWRPPHVQDFDMKSDLGKAAFEEARRIYKDAISWPTDNIQSSGITFSWDDGGELSHEVMKHTTLR